MTAVAEQPERLGTCRVCGYPVKSDEAYTQDFVSGWYFHAGCQMPESEKRRDEE
ncbi:immunoglobulin domain-containing family protein [Alicyclobacillus dauci]|uniref:Uncharacterized protein n=1 Tax=Alicyclobacillus dauci TaxID=1475485 RepID=A0ABY6YY53_9BACL|nr:hypothetical protein [Alicyclobacillus dauci]WAH35009.1 hypothetical protein NZD86_11775 [Alicyclobacillus dauci]